MKILWLSWKDIGHPQSGGSEVVMHELSKRLMADGHSVTILTALYDGSSKKDTIDGINIIRVGKNRYLHPFVALIYYIRHLRNKFDCVIEVVNTAPYMSPFFKGKAQSVLFYHQLAREIWFYEAPFPLSWIGYLILEPFATFLLGKSQAKVITVSKSTKNDLLRFGFNSSRIHIISEGIQINPIKSLSSENKYSDPTLLSFGSMRAMKRTIDQVKAFELVKKKIPTVKLKIAGDNNSHYGEKVKKYIDNSLYKSDIEILGKVSQAEKLKLMKRSSLFLATSLKEGWCLVVTEAASQGTPAIVYDVDGLRDSVKDGRTGYITEPTPLAMSRAISRCLDSTSIYNRFREMAWRWSKLITFNKCYEDFINILEIK